MTVPAVALVGVAGYGSVHLERIAPLLAAGRLHLAAACDVRPPDTSRQGNLPAGIPFFTSHHDLLRQVHPDAVIIATPPHTHAAITADALRAGADVLVEKPPFARLADHDRVARLERETGRRCQVGFQSLASPALAELLAAVTAGRLGTVETVTLAGSWTRTDAYYQRTRWAGRRWLDGEPIPDGALSNPFAHGVMNLLAVAAAAAGSAHPHALELELYRTRDLEVEDTACLHIHLPAGIRATAAVTLCARRQRPPWMVISGTAGRARLDYTEDRLQLPGDPRPRHIPGRITLLENLLDHRADPTRVPLIAPLDRVRPFTSLVETIHASPVPHPIPPEFLETHGSGPDRQIVIEGVEEVVDRAAEQAALFSELGLPWAHPPAAVLSARHE